jgi:hypothetical protein
METRRNAAAGRERAGLCALPPLLCAVAAAEVLVPACCRSDSGDLLAAAEGIHAIME